MEGHPVQEVGGPPELETAATLGQGMVGPTGQRAEGLAQETCGLAGQEAESLAS